jgi:hypothetical protein
MYYYISNIEGLGFWGQIMQAFPLLHPPSTTILRTDKPTVLETPRIHIPDNEYVR